MSAITRESVSNDYFWTDHDTVLIGRSEQRQSRLALFLSNNADLMAKSMQKMKDEADWVGVLFPDKDWNSVQRVGNIAGSFYGMGFALMDRLLSSKTKEKRNSLSKSGSGFEWTQDTKEDGAVSDSQADKKPLLIGQTKLLAGPDRPKSTEVDFHYSKVWPIPHEDMPAQIPAYGRTLPAPITKFIEGPKRALPAPPKALPEPPKEIAQTKALPAPPRRLPKPRDDER